MQMKWSLGHSKTGYYWKVIRIFIIEGAIISAYAIEADVVYIFLAVGI